MDSVRNRKRKIAIALLNLYLSRRRAHENERQARLRRMRRAFAAQYMNLLLTATLHARAPRGSNQNRSEAVWIYLRDKAPDDEFLENFRMTRYTFRKIVKDLRPLLEPLPNPSSRIPPVPVEKKVALTIFQLCSTAEHRVVGHIFGVDQTTVQRHFYATVQAIIKYYMKKKIFFPNAMECERLSQENFGISGILQVILAIDATHIEIQAPEGSVILQAAVDNKYKFRDICIKFPGSSHNAYVFRHSRLFKYPNRVIPDSNRFLEDRKIPYIIVGDPTHPLLDWLMKDYQGENLTSGQESFNHALQKCRVFAECAFGRLNGRFRLLQNSSEIPYLFMPKVIAACCILNNIIEDEIVPPEYPITPESLNMYFQPEVQDEQNDEDTTTNSKMIRNLLRKYRQMHP